ncbi:hypothetical protein AHAS_Ahas13G0496200 [Arachis hypogaea]
MRLSSYCHFSVRKKVQESLENLKEEAVVPKREMGLWTLLEGFLLLANALEILNEDRFLDKIFQRRAHRSYLRNSIPKSSSHTSQLHLHHFEIYFWIMPSKDLPTESETMIPYVHSMKQAHKILRTVISPRLICSKLLRYLQQLQLGQWQLTILGWPQISLIIR